MVLHQTEIKKKKESFMKKKGNWDIYRKLDQVLLGYYYDLLYILKENLFKIAHFLVPSSVNSIRGLVHTLAFISFSLFIQFLLCLLKDILTSGFFSLSELPDYLFTMP